jgi:hypothetical protein
MDGLSAGVTGRLPTTTIQSAIYADHLRWPGSVSLSAAMQLDGVLDQAAIERAYQALIARQPLLRSRFVRVDGELRAIERDLPGEWTAQSLAPSRLEDALAEEAARSFDLAHDGPIRAALYRLDSERHVLQLSLHHVAYDAAAAFVIIDELLALYRREVGAAAGALPRPEPYGRLVESEQRYLASEQCARDRAYWHDLLRGSSLKLALGEAERVAHNDWQMQGMSQPLPASLSESLLRRANGHDRTLFEELTTAYLLALRDHTGCDDLVLGTTVSLRDRPRWRTVVGPAINYLALRAELHGVTRAADAFAAVRTRVDAALEHRRYPFARLLAELLDERARATLPELGLNANFNYYDTAAFPQDSDTVRARFGQPVMLGAVRATEVPFTSGPVIRPYDLNCTAWRVGDGLTLQLRYNARLFTRGGVQTLLERFCNWLAALGGNE